MEITREKLRQTPRYKNSLALDKIAMENTYLPEARRYRYGFQIPLGIIGVIGSPIATYYLSKKGVIAANPDVIRYGLGGIIGLISGWTVGFSIGTIAYETFSQEGDIHQFFSKVKKHFTKKN